MWPVRRTMAMISGPRGSLGTEAPTANDAAADSEYSRSARAGRSPYRRVRRCGRPGFRAGRGFPPGVALAALAAELVRGREQFYGHASVVVVWRSDHGHRGLKGMSGAQGEEVVALQLLDPRGSHRPWSGLRKRAARPGTPGSVRPPVELVGLDARAEPQILELIRMLGRVRSTVTGTRATSRPASTASPGTTSPQAGANPRTARRGYAASRC